MRKGTKVRYGDKATKWNIVRKLGIISAVALMIVLLGSSPAFAFGNQNVSLGMTCNVIDGTTIPCVYYPGVQTYAVRGGQLVEATILGDAVDGQNSQLSYSLNAVVSDGTASGNAYFNLVVISSQHGRTEVRAAIDISGMTPLPIPFPGGGAIPGFFDGTATLQVYSGGSVTTIPNVGISIESPYLNPFGGPILISTDSSSNPVVIVATYSQARIDWTDVELAGSVSGTIGGSAVSGQFEMSVTSSEDLRAGTETDYGSIAFAFSQTSLPWNKAQGDFFGYSTIPPPISSNCGSFPYPYCLTGLQSSGVFSQTTNGGSRIAGQYSTIWGVPAVTFFSQVSATLVN